MNDVIKSLAAEQQKIKAEITEDGFKYKNHVLDLSLPANEPTFFIFDWWNTDHSVR